MTRRGANEGTIRERKDGRWEARVLVTRSDGRRTRRSLLGRTRAEVRDKLQAALRAEASGLPLPADRVTVGRFLRPVATRLGQTERPTPYLRQLRQCRPGPPRARPWSACTRPPLAPARASLPQREVGIRTVAAKRRVSAGRAPPGVGTGGAVGDGDPQRRETGRPTAHPATRGSTILTGGSSAFPRRDPGRPTRGPVSRRARRWSSAGRDPRPRLERRRLGSIDADRPPCAPAGR